MSTKIIKAMFWVVGIALIAFFVWFGIFTQWSAYCQIASAIGQEPSVWAFLGWIAFRG